MAGPTLSSNQQPSVTLSVPRNGSVISDGGEAFSSPARKDTGGSEVDADVLDCTDAASPAPEISAAVDAVDLEFAVTRMEDVALAGLAADHSAGMSQKMDMRNTSLKSTHDALLM